MVYIVTTTMVDVNKNEVGKTKDELVNCQTSFE